MLRNYLSVTVPLKNYFTVLRPNWLCKTTKATIYLSSYINAKGLPIKMPSLSPTMMEGTIVKWLKKEGEAFQAGDILCFIQTDKAVVSFEIDEEGILAKILIGEDGSTVKVGTLIGVYVEEGEDWQSVEIPADDSSSSSEETPAIEVKEESSSQAVQSVGLWPSVRLLLQKYGIDGKDISGTGPRGILLKGDVLTHINNKNLKPLPTESILPPAAPKPTSAAAVHPKPSHEAKRVEAALHSDIELTSMRKTIARRLLQSKTGVPHTYVTLDCSISDILKLRKKLKQDGVIVSMNDIIIKAVAFSLSRCPEINCYWGENQLVVSREVDVSVAVATEAGLITPIVKRADLRSLADISKIVKDLATRAREGTLKLDEFQGGTFTISNLGMFGINEFRAIINPPQCAVLAVGSGRLELDENGEVDNRMQATLSYDQSAITDDSAAHFMSILKEVLESPNVLLIGMASDRRREQAALK